MTAWQESNRNEGIFPRFCYFQLNVLSFTLNLCFGDYRSILNSLHVLSIYINVILGNVPGIALGIFNGITNV